MSLRVPRFSRVRRRRQLEVQQFGGRLAQVHRFQHASPRGFGCRWGLDAALRGGGAVEKSCNTPIPTTIAYDAFPLCGYFTGAPPPPVSPPPPPHAPNEPLDTNWLSLGPSRSDETLSSLVIENWHEVLLKAVPSKQQSRQPTLPNSVHTLGNLESVDSPKFAPKSTHPQKEVV